MGHISKFDFTAEGEHRCGLGTVDHMKRRIENLEDPIGRCRRFSDGGRHPREVLDGGIAGQDRRHEHCKIAEGHIDDSIGDHPASDGNGKRCNQVVQAFDQAPTLGPSDLGTDLGTPKLIRGAFKLLLTLLLEPKTLHHPDSREQLGQLLRRLSSMGESPSETSTDLLCLAKHRERQQKEQRNRSHRHLPGGDEGHCQGEEDGQRALKNFTKEQLHRGRDTPHIAHRTRDHITVSTRFEELDRLTRKESEQLVANIHHHLNPHSLPHDHSIETSGGHNQRKCCDEEGH